MGIPNQVAIKVLEDCKAIIRDKTTTHIIFKKENVIVRLPKNQDIDYSHLEAIVIEQLGVSWWELDYILGENGITPNSL